MATRRRKIIIMAIVAIVSVIIIISAWILTRGYGASDYQATYDEFDSMSKNGENKIIYVMPSVWGYPDDEVGLTDCAFSLVINGTSLPLVNLHLINHGGLFGSPPWESYAQVSKGAGPFNAVTFFQGNVSYIVTLFDVDINGHITNGDQVTVECTEPLAPETSYLLNVFVDIDGTWGVGKVYGTFQN